MIYFWDAFKKVVFYQKYLLIQLKKIKIFCYYVFFFCCCFNKINILSGVGFISLMHLANKSYDISEFNPKINK